MTKIVRNLVSFVAVIAMATCPVLVHQVVKLNKSLITIETQNKLEQENIRKSLSETVVTFSKDGELNTTKIPVGRSLHVITSGDKLIKIEVEEHESDLALDPRYASLFKE